MPTFRNEDFGEALDELWGERPPDDFESNGCSLCPEVIAGVQLSPACHLRDWHYTKGGTARCRLDADIIFLENLNRLGVDRLKLWWCPWTIDGATFGYRRVRLWGYSHFNWGEGDRPPMVLDFIVNLFLRYIHVRFLK